MDDNLDNMFPTLVELNDKEAVNQSYRELLAMRANQERERRYETEFARCRAENDSEGMLALTNGYY